MCDRDGHGSRVDQGGCDELRLATAPRPLRLRGSELAPPTDMPWGERVAYFADPDGTRIHIYGPVRKERSR